MEAYNLALVLIFGGLGLTALSVYFFLSLRKEERLQKIRNMSFKEEHRAFLQKTPHYKNLSDESFESVYNHSGNVTWQINDKKILEKLVEIPDIDEKIEIISIENWERDYFIFQFKFKKWEILNKKIPLDVSNVYSFRKI